MQLVSMDQDLFDYPYKDSVDCLDQLRAMGFNDIKAYPEKPVPTEAQIYDRLKDADVVFWGIYPIPNSVLDRLPKLKIAVFYGVGAGSYIDIKHAESKGIKVLNTPNYGSNTVAEYALGLAFALARKVCMADRRMRAADWRQHGLEGLEIAGLKYGIVGTGAIGTLVAKKASLLGAHVIASDIYESDELKEKYGVKYMPLPELMSTADIVSLHVNVCDATKKMITGKLIRSMKKGSFFINCARSAIVESYEPVFEMLRNGTLGGAAIDVWDSEPIPSFAPCQIENIITTPHIAYLTCTAMVNTMKIAAARTAETWGK